MSTTEVKRKAGRRPGSLGHKNVRKMAMKTLQNVIEDDAAPAEAKVSAAIALLQEIPR